MQRIQNHKHTKDNFFYALSRLFDRAGYYGIRAVLVLYLIDEQFQMNRAEALSIYGVLTTSVVLSKILGAILGDLVIGNRKAIIYGGFLQALGAFVLCLPNTIGLYVGLSILVIGSGLYTPNLISTFGKSYFNKTKLLDSGFTMFYFVVNIGAFLGSLSIGYLGEVYSWNLAFITAAILTILSLILILLTQQEKKPTEVLSSQTPMRKRVLNTTTILVLVALFWGVYRISSVHITTLMISFRKLSISNIPKILLTTDSSIYTIPICLIATIVWTYFYSSHLTKLIIGFVSAAFAYGILFLIPETVGNEHLVIYLISAISIGIAETHITPLVYSTLTRYANPKYLSILISLSSFSTGLILLPMALLSIDFYEKPHYALTLSVTLSVVIGLGLMGYLFWSKKQPRMT